MNLQTVKLKIIKLLSGGIVNIIAILIGLYIGIYHPDLGKAIGIYGKLYITVLQMCVFPIIITSLTISIVSLSQPKYSGIMIRILLFLALMSIISSLVGISIAYLSNPAFEFALAESPILADVVEVASQIKRGLLAPLAPDLKKGISVFLGNALTDNVFQALSGNETFQVVIFTIIFAISLAKLNAEEQDALSPIFQVILKVFNNIFNVFTIVLPFFVVCLVAETITLVGKDTLLAMGGVFGKYCISGIILFLLMQTVIMLRTKLGPIKTLKMLKTPLIIGIATRNSIAAIPATIDTLINNFRFDPNIVEAIVTLGTFLGRFGYTTYFAFATIFVTQIYGMQLTISDYGFIAFTSIAAGMATAGLPGKISLTMFAVTLEPLGIPVGTVITLFFSIEPLVQPIRTVGVIHGNCALVSLISSPQLLRAK
ncbi:MAG: cation:dicarboxylase symporter family transporter [Pseudomonadota bacterium]